MESSLVVSNCKLLFALLLRLSMAKPELPVSAADLLRFSFTDERGNSGADGV